MFFCRTKGSTEVALPAIGGLSREGAGWRREPGGGQADSSRRYEFSDPTHAGIGPEDKDLEPVTLRFLLGSSE
ncbi:hypothetical protein K1T71_001553 [Dendrolimus kikuchii]|uniref:Uncharacterized protein n=1 Tax=Dendrolimus kikuchii TaxID=765133 RepID=A0ACC1DJK3_9NEOP|nr:hypothetical protein K1T71_001553 [Dendrolimus kikuchii]